MSLYNLLFGTNPFSGVLLQMLGVSRDDVPRFRDCFLSDDASEIIIHTRTGGGNRDSYQAENDALALVDGYKFDADDDFDCTYADFHYEVPEAFKTQIALLKDLGAVTNPAERWQQMLDGLRGGDTSRPDVQRALAVGEQIMGQLQKAPAAIPITGRGEQAAVKTIEWNLETSMQGADWSGEIEVEDDATDAQIDELVREEVFNIVSWGWTVKEPPANPAPDKE